MVQQLPIHCTIVGADTASMLVRRSVDSNVVVRNCNAVAAPKDGTVQHNHASKACSPN